jgi:hypothetical protein
MRTLADWETRRGEKQKNGALLVLASRRPFSAALKSFERFSSRPPPHPVPRPDGPTGGKKPKQRQQKFLLLVSIGFWLLI